MGKIADFSHHQGNVDWSKASKELDLAIIRVQYGSTTIDREYKKYVAECKKYNVPFGHYAYCLFVSKKDAIVEAEDFHKRADKDALFLVADVEQQTTKTAKEMAPATQAFIDTLKAKGWKVGLYSGHHTYEPLGMSKVKADFVWIPRYGTTKPAFDCDLWQYTETGKMAGVPGNIDLNRLTGSKPLSYFTGGKVAKPVSKPTSNPKPTVNTKATVHTVRKGETLSGIASKYGTTVANLVKINSITDKNLIKTGQKIKLKGSATKPNKDKASYYKIKNGDTLSGIAKKYGTTVSNLQKLNGIGNKHKIYAGQKIKVTGTAEKATSKKYHTVKSGDTVSGLASKYNTTQAEIKKWNGLKNVHKIYIGQKLRVK